MPVIVKSNNTNPGFHVTASAQVSVTCEMCGTAYAYAATLTGYSSNNRSAAQDDLINKVDQVKAGNYNLVAEEKRCPQCGYLQAWMIEPVRRRRGWMIAIGLAMAVCFVAILAEALIIPEDIRNDAVQGIFMVFGLPVITFFVARVIVMKTYRPNRQVAPRTNLPSVSV